MTKSLLVLNFLCSLKYLTCLQLINYNSINYVDFVITFFKTQI